MTEHCEFGRPGGGCGPDAMSEPGASTETLAMRRLAVLARDVVDGARRAEDAVGVELGRIVCDDLDRRATAIADAGCSDADDRVLQAVEQLVAETGRASELGVAVTGGRPDGRTRPWDGPDHAAGHRRRPDRRASR